MSIPEKILSSQRPEIQAALENLVAITDLAGGSVVAGIYLNQILGWLISAQAEVIFKSYREIKLATLLPRMQQDLAIRKLKKKEWFNCYSDNQHGEPGLTFVINSQSIAEDLGVVQ